MPDIFMAGSISDKKKYFIVPKDRKGEIYEVFYSVKCSKQSGEKREGSNMAGLANIVLNDSFAIGNVSIVQDKNGMFVAMPSYKTGSKYQDDN